MKTFKDSEGREWTLALNIDTAKRVKTLLNIDLLALDAGDPSPLQRLAYDLMFIGDLVCACVRPQLEKAGLKDEDFARAMGGDALLAAHTALMQEIEDFFRLAGRQHLARAISVQGRTVRLAVEAIDRRVEQISPEDAVERALAEPTPGSPSTHSPGSSESNPAR